MTNLERIKNMTAEEMVSFILLITDCENCPARDKCGFNETCHRTIFKWLKRKAK